MDNRYRDYVGFPPLLRSGENDGKSFSDFYRASQIELFSVLDNALSQKAEDTLSEFSAVKKADVQLQTPLGNRKAQIGINIMGAFAESQSSAFGWQVRAFGGKDNIGGANAGVFFRRLENEWLYGINVFADYESGKYGEFLRYGIGGELQNPFSALAVNYYLPITDDKRQGQLVAFSQKGIDVNLRVAIPQLDGLKVRGDYYYFDGKYGGEDDKGFRYGLEVQPINDLRIGVFYDDGGEKFGGDIAYVYNFGNPQKRESNVKFSPDLFSPVLREYSQRIMTAQLGPQLRFITMAMTINTGTMIIPQMVFTNTMTMAGMTTILTTETPTMTATRMASVHFISYLGFDFLGDDTYLIISTQIKQLIILPASQVSPPIVIMTTRHFDTGQSSGEAIIVGGAMPPLNRAFAVGEDFNFGTTPESWTLTIVEGSEDFISVAITLTNKNTTTVPHIITETPTTIEMMTITTKLTTFATSTMTIGANTGAAKVDSHLPPSFPPSSFPLSFPQVPKLALAAPVIPARRAGIQHNRVAIIQKPRRQYAQ